MENHSYVPEMNGAWLLYLSSLIYCWIWFAEILLGIFAFSQGILIYFSLYGIGFRVILISKNGTGNITSHFFRRICVELILFLTYVFDIHQQYFCSKILNYEFSVFNRYRAIQFINFFLREFGSLFLKSDLYILSNYLVYWHEFVNNIDSLSFNDFKTYSFITFFIPGICQLCQLFFLIIQRRDLSILSSQRPSFLFHWCSYNFTFFVSIISCKFSCDFFCFSSV